MSIANSEKARTVLVLAAHPDDEVLGCGATLAKLASQGASVHVAFLADGETSRPGRDGVAGVQARQAAAHKACQLLGVGSVSFGGFPDNRLDGVDLLDLVQAVEAEVAQRKPQLVPTHHGGDLNVDHRRVHQATVTACRPQSNHCVETLLFFEVPSSTEWQVPPGAPFVPNWFEDVTEWVERKLLALQAYEAELREWPHPRSVQAIEALFKWRGATVGVAAAEAFMLGRQRA